MTIEEFCEGWVALWNRLKEERCSKYKIGKAFEKYFEDTVLSSFVPSDFKIAAQSKIDGIDYKFDFLFIKADAPNSKEVEPSSAMAAFEVKSHGFFKYADVKRIGLIFQDIKRRYPKILIFYITFKETKTYDKKVRTEWGDLAPIYYRLADSGDGIQMPPPRLFPNEWDKLMKCLSVLK